MFRLAYFLLIIFSLLIYYGCGSSSGTSRYGTNSDNNNTNNNSGRFSSDNDNTTSTDDNNTYTNEDDVEAYDDLPEDDEVDISSVIEKYSPDENTSTNEQGTLKEKMLMSIIKYLDTPYKYGGNSKKGIDCSAFTQTIYKNSLSIDLLRSAHDQ